MITRKPRQQPLQHENHQERPFQARSGNGVGGTWEAMEGMASITPKLARPVKDGTIWPMKKSLAVGNKAPDFALMDDAGQTVRLSETLARGSVVLIFYPGDRTPGCTVQLCSIRDEWEDFRDANISVFGINHADKDSHRAFSAAHRFPFPLLVDEKRKLSTSYGAVHSLLGVKVTRRTVVGISPDGTVRYLRRGIPKNADILKALKPFAKLT